MAYPRAGSAMEINNLEPFRFMVVGDTIVACRPSSAYPLGADAHADELLRWLRQDKFPWLRFTAPMWVPASVLKELLYPEFLAVVELEPHPWPTVARRLRKLTDWRQKDRRQGAGRHGPSPTEYLIRGQRKPRRGS